MSKKETFDKIFDALLDEAIETIESQPDVNLPEETEVTFSKRHEERMRKLFAKERAKAKRKKIYRHIQRMAACFLALILVSGVTVMSVDALRVRFLNFVFDTEDIRTIINLEEEGSRYSNEDVILEYIPEGFVLDKESVDATKIYLKFKRDEEYFSVSISETYLSKSIDTENASCEKMTINDMEAMYSENDNKKVLVLHDDEYIYTIKSNISKKEIVEIAQKIKNN